MALDAAARPGAGGGAAGGDLDAVEVLVGGFVAGRFGGEQEVAAGVEHGLADGLAGVQVVAEVDGAQRGGAGAVAVQPAFDGLALAVLLVGAVLGLDELRGQRQRAGLARGDEGGGEHLVEALRAAVVALAGRAVRAVDFARAEELRAVQGDQRPCVEAAHGGQGAVRVQVPGDGVELIVHVRWRRAVEQLPDLVNLG